MRKCVAVIVLLFMNASLAVSIQSPGEWIKYASPEGHYTVSLPAPPNLSTQDATAGTGERFPQYLAAVAEPGNIAIYNIAYFDQPSGTTYNFDTARDSMVRAFNGTLLNESSIRLGSYPGRELLISAKCADETDYLVRIRLYDIEKRVYLLMFVLPKSIESDLFGAKASKYFDSFQVVKN